MKRSDTQTIIDALRVLELISDDGVAQALILEAADRMDELRRQQVDADRLANGVRVVLDEGMYETQTKELLEPLLSAYTATKGGE